MWYFNTTVLLLLTVQRSVSSILLHEAGHSYSTGLAVLLGEGLKQMICVIISLYQLRGQVRMKLPEPATSIEESISIYAREYEEAAQLFKERVFTKEAWKTLIPAALYVVQNNLYLYASGRLRPGIFQAVWQVRLVPTALLSQILLQKKLGKRQWLALFVILGGVITLQQCQQVNIVQNAADVSLSSHSRISAIAALLFAATLASIAGVYLEKIFQQKETNLWVANFQLSTFSIAPAVLVVFVECSQSVDFWDPFKSFSHSFWPWITVLIHGLAGILVALSTKYAGCIAGSISGIASIALTHSVQLARGAIATSAGGEASFLAGFCFIAMGVGVYSHLSARTQINVFSQDMQQVPSASESHVSLEMRVPPWPAEKQGLSGSYDISFELPSSSSLETGPKSEVEA